MVSICETAFSILFVTCAIENMNSAPSRYLPRCDQYATCESYRNVDRDRILRHSTDGREKMHGWSVTQRLSTALGRAKLSISFVEAADVRAVLRVIDGSFAISWRTPRSGDEDFLSAESIAYEHPREHGDESINALTCLFTCVAVVAPV